VTSRSRQATVLTVEDELDRAFLRLVPGEAGGERERRHHLVMIEGLLHDGLSEEEVEHALDRANGWGPAGRPPTGRIRPLRRVFRGGRFPARRRG
jgi:hypothetical protein